MESGRDAVEWPGARLRSWGGAGSAGVGASQAAENG